MIYCWILETFLTILWEKSFRNLKMKHCIWKSNRLKSLNMSSSSPKMFFEKVILKFLVLLGECLWWSLIFVNLHPNCQWFFRFCPPLQIFSLLSLLWLFWRLFLKTPLGDCFWNILASGTCWWELKVFCEFLPYWTVIHSLKHFSRDQL